MNARQTTAKPGTAATIRVAMARCVLALVAGACLLAAPDAAAAGRTYTDPIDGTKVRPYDRPPRGSTRRYSDLESAARNYAGMILVGPKSGYVAWVADFERPVSPELRDFVLRELKPHARRSSQDATVAYEVFNELLHYRGAPDTERVGALLFHSYLLKRQRGQLERPGQIRNAARLEHDILQARRRALSLLAQVARDKPPKTRRAQLEWEYLIGELLRLTGEPDKALPLLRYVCENRDDAGYSVGKLACEMRDRAARKETWEDYRDAMYDVRPLLEAERAAAAKAADAAKPKGAAKDAAKDAAKPKAAATKRAAATEKAAATKKATATRDR